MNIEETINRYLELKPCKNWIESIEPKFFFEFAETVITAYEKEKETSHYNQSQLDIANAKLIEEKEKNKNKDKILRNIREEFLKYDWKDANPIQTYNQIKSLYESIYCKPYED